MAALRSVTGVVCLLSLLFCFSPTVPSVHAAPKDWTAFFGSGEGEILADIATDMNGNVYVAGSTFGSLPGSTSAGSYDGFVMKFNSTGTLLWTRQFGTEPDDYANDVAVDALGNVYVVGMTNGSLDDQALVYPPDAFVVKYNTDGAKLWTRLIATTSHDEATSVVVDVTGIIYVAGRTGTSLDGQPHLGRDDAFISALDSDGNRMWSRLLGSPWVTNERATDVAVDGAGHLYISGYTGGLLAGETQYGYLDAFVAALDLNTRSFTWVRQFGDETDDRAQGIAADATGVYVVGSTEGKIGPPPIGEPNAFITRYAADGTLRGFRSFGTTSDDLAWDVKLTGNNTFTIVGSTKGQLEGQPNPGGEFGDTNQAFLQTYTVDEGTGTLLSTTLYGGQNNDAGLGVAITSNGRTYLLGTATNTMDGETVPTGRRNFVKAFGGTFFDIYLPLITSVN